MFVSVIHQPTWLRELWGEEVHRAQIILKLEATVLLKHGVTRGYVNRFVRDRQEGKARSPVAQILRPYPTPNPEPSASTGASTASSSNDRDVDRPTKRFRTTLDFSKEE